MNSSRFNDLTDIYDAMIDWPRRLASDGPFYQSLFDRVRARRVADLACGTGRHAAMFHSWGLAVEAADVSPNMIAKARELFDEPAGLRWAVRGFEEPVPWSEPCDAVTCLGNSLALAGDRSAARQAVANMADALRPGGLLVIHVLNAWRLPDGPCHWQKCLHIALPRGDALITKGVQRVGDRAFVHLVVAPLDAPEEFHSESVPFLPLTGEELAEFAQTAGVANAELLGNQKRAPYVRESSSDLILVAEKHRD